MYHILLGCLFVLLSLQGVCQDYKYEKIDWEEEPQWKKLDTSYSDDQEVVLQNERLFEFAYAEKYDNRLVEYFTTHKIVRVFGDDDIQKNNKVYISMNGVLELLEAKARVITPDNKIINLDESNILESEAGDGYDAHKYFAIDGVVKGADIEYTYTTLRIPAYNGVKVNFQDDHIQNNVRFKLISPSNLYFAFKSYNDFPEVKKDTSIEDKNVYEVLVDSIGVLKDEDYAPYDRNLQYLVFKLDKNYAKNKTNIISFGGISQDIYSVYYNELDGGSKKQLQKFINESGAGKAKSEEQKIRLLETAIKTKLGIIDNVKTKTIKEIISDGYTSDVGILYLTVQALRMLEIKHEMVLTCNRYEDIFDEDFEHYQVLKNNVIYFPDLKLYMAPDKQLFRLGMIPSQWMNQKGLFIKEIEVGGMKTGLGKVKYIDPLNYKTTQDNMQINIDFSDVSQPVIDFKRELSGYSCVYFQGVYNLLEDEQKKELDESLIKFADNNGEVIEYTVTGTSSEECGIKPMSYAGKLKSTTLMEKAGNRFLFKIGQVIGPQMEMYQEEERVSDIQHDHNMTYQRTVRFEIPEGYEISGLEALKIKEYYPQEEPILLFESDYTMEGNKVEVIITETYKKMFFTKDEINDFRRIINAAANFNKVVLFMVKS